VTDNTNSEFSWGRTGHLPRASASSAARSEQGQPCVYIILLNWNGWQDTLECMRSLRRLEYRNWRAVIVDNGSTDDSVVRLREACPEATILETHKNLGFAAGNNVGIRCALNNGADYVFVLNNDTTVFSDTISAFVGFAEKHPTAALMGPKIDRRNPQREWPIRRKLDLLTQLCTFTALRRLVACTPVIRGVFYCTDSQPSVVQFLPGSALFFRATTFKKAGFFDESTFLDFEELIMAEKVRKAGFSAYFVPQATIRHKGSASASKLRAKRYIENAKSEEYFFSHYVRLSPLGRSTVRLIRFLTYGARALRYRNYREHFAEFMDALCHRWNLGRLHR
jgi:GT2 family glycosyltransferase